MLLATNSCRQHVQSLLVLSGKDLISISVQDQTAGRLQLSLCPAVDARRTVALSQACHLYTHITNNVVV